MRVRISGAMFRRSFVPINQKHHINETGIHIHVGANTFNQFVNALLRALVVIRKERQFRQDRLVF